MVAVSGIPADIVELSPEQFDALLSPPWVTDYLAPMGAALFVLVFAGVVTMVVGWRR